MHTTISPAILYWGTPVVLLTTENEDGTTNISPISSAFWLGHRCIIGVASSSKCTQNVLRTKQIVLNLPTEDLVSNVNKLARSTGTDPPPPWKNANGYTYVKDKFALAGFTQQNSELVRPARILECPIQMEAELVEANEIMKDSPERKGLVYEMELKILRIHIEEDLRLPGYANRVDSNKLRLLIMAFQEFHGMTRRLEKSRLADITEESYRPLTEPEIVQLPPILSVTVPN